jgi:hypothetical protein
VRQQQQEALVEERLVRGRRLEQASGEGPSVLRLSRQLEECSAVRLGRQRGGRLVELEEGSVRLALETLQVLSSGTAISNVRY